MKICIVAQSFAPQKEGGAEISSRHLAQNLSKHHEVVVLSLGEAGSEVAPLGECITEQRYRLVRIPFRNIYLPELRSERKGAFTRALWHAKTTFSSVSSKDLRFFLNAEQFDLIYAQNCIYFQPILYRVAKSLNIPVCQHLRDYAFLCARSSMFYSGENCTSQCFKCRLLRAGAANASHYVKTVISVSDFVRQKHLEHGLFKGANSHVLYNTNTSQDEFDPKLLAARPSPGRFFTIGYIGAISEEKGIKILLDAILDFAQEIPVKLVIAGEGDLNFISFLKAHSLNDPFKRVEWLGHVKPEVLYSQCDLLAVPSLWHEPQGRIIVEAATYGIPVVAAASGGIPEFVHKHRIGECYDANDAYALSQILKRFAILGPANFRSLTPKLFPGLKEFNGTSEASHYYQKLNIILENSLTA